MAEKNVVVRLRALVDDYKRGMGEAAKSTDKVTGSAKKFETLGATATRVGDSLTKSVTLPLVAVGAASLKMSSDFDAVFTQMQALAGVSADEVDGLKESVLGLAGETGRAPQELAEAFYFLNSSGLDTAASMEALEASAKASAAGLGNTATIADAVSSAMNAYAREGLKAAEATDVLVATARAGKAEPEQLASSLGQVLPIASELGVTFEDVGGAIASLSLSGNDAARSSTLLTNILSKLLKPSQQGAEALEEVGLSVEGLRDMIADQGLLGTLETLKERLGDAGFVKFMEDAQAVQGALALTGQNADQVKGIFDEVADSAGATENAFSTWADSMGSSNARAWAELQATLIRLGDTIAPIAADVAGAVSTIADAFNSLPDGVQQAVVYVGMFAAAAGPLMSLGGRLTTVLGAVTAKMIELAVPTGTVSGAFSNAAVSSGAFSRSLVSLGKVGLVVGALVALRETLGTIADDVEKADLSELENQLLDLADSGEVAGDTLERLFDDDKRGSVMAGDAEQAVADLDALDSALASLEARDPEAAAAAFSRIREELREMGLSAGDIEDRFDEYNAALASTDTASRTTESAVADATAEFDEQTGAVNEAAAAIKGYADAITAQFDPLWGLIDAQDALMESQVAVTEAQAALNAAVEEHGPNSAEAAEAQRQLEAAQLDGVRSAYDLEQAELAAAEAAAAEGLSVAEARDRGREWAAQAGLTGAAADDVANRFAWAAAQADGYAGDYTANIKTSGTQSARLAIDGVGQMLNDVDGRSATVKINVAYTSYGNVKGAAEALRSTEKRAMGGPVGAGRLYEVAEQGRAELLQMGGRTYLIPGMDGTVVPAGGTSGGGSSYIDNRSFTFNVHGGDPQHTVDLLRRYMRANGPVPIRTTG